MTGPLQVIACRSAAAPASRCTRSRPPMRQVRSVCWRRSAQRACTWATASVASTGRQAIRFSMDLPSNRRCATAWRSTTAWRPPRDRSSPSTWTIRKPLRWRQLLPRSGCRRRIRAHGRRRCSSPCTVTLHAPQPPQRRFAPALHPPDEPPRAALWFAFNGDRLLVHSQADRADLPEYADLAQLGADFESGHYLGRMDDVDCYAVDLESETPPEGLAFEGLRALFGRLPDEQYSIAGRAVQI